VKPKKLIVSLLLDGSGLMAAAMPQNALAQSTVPARETVSGEDASDIIVTAQRREENLQSVPVSMQALGEQALEQRQVTSFDDYAKLLSSVSFQGEGPGESQLYFRGVTSGGDGLHAGSLPATGFYIDDIPATTVGGSIDFRTYDIARVEALAGPQGTLFGASSLSGTLRLITNKPQIGVTSGGIDLDLNKFGTGDFGGSIDAFLNLPISNHAALRLVGYYDRDGGFIDNVPSTRTFTFGDGDPTNDLTINNANLVENNFNDTETWGARAALKIDLDDNWTVTPSVIYQRRIGSGTFLFDPRKGDLNVSDFRASGVSDRWHQAALTIEGKIGNWDLNYTGGYFERTLSQSSDYSEYSVVYDAFGYTSFPDIDGSLGDPSFYFNGDDKYTKHTQEIRISSPADSRLRLTAGAFYQRQTNRISAEYPIDGIPEFYEVTGTDDVYYMSHQRRVDRDYALFGEIDYDILPNLTLTAGIRGFQFNNSLYGFFGFGANLPYGGESNCFAPSNDSFYPCINTDSGKKKTGETHKVNLSWQVEPNKMLYVTYSTGFRPGGANRRPTVRSYDEDTLTNFELGWKTRLFDNRLRFNGAAFYQKWKDIQYGLAGPNSVTSIFNAGNANIKGVEIDMSWAIGSLTLSGSASYIDAKLATNFCPAPNGVVTSDCATPSARKGTRLPISPRLKTSTNARYKFDIGTLDSFLQASFNYQSGARSALNDVDAIAQGPLKSFATVDFSMGVSQDAWSLTLYINNAFDKRGPISFEVPCGIPECAATKRIYATKPQQFGIQTSYKF
jgi:iron complex outermembrane receptor protein